MPDDKVMGCSNQCAFLTVYRKRSALLQIIRIPCDQRVVIRVQIDGVKVLYAQYANLGIYYIMFGMNGTMTIETLQLLHSIVEKAVGMNSSEEDK